eukprot:SAG31_NODE_1778_length_7297_cov_10.330786_8_plen_132_part_00
MPKDVKHNVLTHVDELARELSEQDIEDEIRQYESLNRRDKAKEKISEVRLSVMDVGYSAKQGPKSFTKTLVGNSMDLTKGVTISVAKGTGKSIKKGGKVGLHALQGGGSDSPRPGVLFLYLLLRDEVPLPG